MHILGVSCFYHDAAAALLRDGRLIAAAEEERFTRVKHDFGFPTNAIRFCLKTAGISERELDYVVFYEKPFVKFERIMMTTLQTFPRSWKVFREAMVTWLLDKLWIRNLIRENIGIPEDRILFNDHHMSHAASAFLCSPFEEAAILTVDGVGEWTTATLGVGRENSIKILRELRFPHSLGLLYSTFTAFLGFKVNEGEYKVMGMAAYGKPRYVDKVYKLIHVHEDGSFWLDMDYFYYHHSPDRMFSPKFIALFGEPRNPASNFFTPGTPYPSYFGEVPPDYLTQAERNQHYADIAASIQTVTEEVIVRMALHLHQQTGLRKLCMAGGVALNSLANWRVLRDTPFEEIFVQPSAGDGGGAVGAALYTHNVLLGNPRRFVMDHAYWGEEHDLGQIAALLRTSGVEHERVDDMDMLNDRVVDLLSQGKVVGWFQGRFEWGPRALGNRSILADPRKAEMKDIVNTKIKFREPYRPFAPSVLADRAEAFFDLPSAERHYPARFMLYVVDVKDAQRSCLPAITHVDGTARLQTVHKEYNPRYYALIERFGEATGAPMLLNTSFNLRGEPIVNTPAEALSTFARSGMDALILDRFIIRRPVGRESCGRN